jgi:hypothetical protein
VKDGEGGDHCIVVGGEEGCKRICFWEWSMGISACERKEDVIDAWT